MHQKLDGQNNPRTQGTWSEASAVGTTEMGSLDVCTTWLFCYSSLCILFILRNWEMFGTQRVLHLQHPSKVVVHTGYHQIMLLVTDQHGSCYVVHVFQ